MSFWNVNSTTIGNDQVYVNNTYKKPDGNNALSTITSSNPTGFVFIDPNSSDPIVKNLAYAIRNDGKVVYIESGSNRQYNSIQEFRDSKGLFSGYTDNTTLLIKNSLLKNLQQSYTQYNDNNPDRKIGPQSPSPTSTVDPPPLGNDPALSSDNVVPIDTLSGVSNLTLEEQVRQSEANNINDIYIKYPLDEGGRDRYDYIEVQAYEYEGGNIGGASGPKIFLPMTSTMSESTSIGWGADELNPLQKAFGDVALGAIEKGGTGDIPGMVGTTKEGISDIIGKFAGNEKMQGFIKTYFAGQAVQANLLGRQGIVLNPNLELLFQGPKLRSFRYSFRFAPRSGSEAEKIKSMIRSFKREMAPKKDPGELFLTPPSVFKIKYKYKGNDHPFMNRIKPCALTNFDVNYVPDGSYMTYNPGKGGGAGSMTCYAVDMQFDELEPIFRDDQEAAGGMGY